MYEIERKLACCGSLSHETSGTVWYEMCIMTSQGTLAGTVSPFSSFFFFPSFPMCLWNCLHSGVLVCEQYQPTPVLVLEWAKVREMCQEMASR